MDSRDLPVAYPESFILESKEQDDVLNRIFTNRMHPKYYSEKAGIMGDQPVDGTVTYTLDEYGYRTTNSNFGQNDLVFIGCSQTFGYGVSLEAIWGEQLSNMLEMPATNLARPGVGTASLVDSLFIYLANFKKPKKIYALFPDLGRTDVLVAKGVHTSSNEPVLFPGREEALYHSVVWNNERDLCLFPAHIIKNEHKVKISKRPYETEEVYSFDDAVYKNMRAILQLEIMCEIADIEFLWGTWDNGFAATLDKAMSLGYRFKNYVEVSSMDWVTSTGDYVEIDCHREAEEQYKEFFHVGCDRNAHMGAHHHIHVAEAFYNEIKRRGLNE